MTLKVGDKAPNFSLFNTDKKEITLSDFLGKTVVLHFFPLAFTGTCTKQLCTLRDDYSFYNNLNAVVLGMSVDSLHALNRFKQDQNIQFDLISDFNREVAKAYDAQYEVFGNNMKGVARRAAFIIDGNGIIQYAEVLESAGDLPNFEKMKEVLSGLQTA